MASLQGVDQEFLPPVDKPTVDQQDIADTGEGLLSNRFTVSESFRKLETGEAPSVFSGAQTGRETVFKNKAPPKEELPYDPTTCYICGAKLKGKFSRVQKKNVHFDCFNCSVCGDNLRNMGHFEKDGKFYCRNDRPY
ncbi:PDZ and LIM domain protein 1-like [Asterias rubens]|uniref:PDZ and LIM domain protein 1-like n=1 Tax=Asterias rubens TaxID=7604 RepID=UPI0014557B86|nr:PDZ and LIM domain protein 1-like [Asterias rubens]